MNNSEYIFPDNWHEMFRTVLNKRYFELDSLLDVLTGEPIMGTREFSLSVKEKNKDTHHNDPYLDRLGI